MFNTIILHFVHTFYLPVSRDSHDKERLFPYTAFTNWSF